MFNVRKLKKKYKQQIQELQNELDGLEYEPAPSGETNGYFIQCDLLQSEIYTLEMVINDLDKLKNK